MLQHSLFKLKINLEKKTLHSKENINWEDFSDIDPRSLTTNTDPYPHIVIENLFKPHIYAALCEQFSKVKNLGLSTDKKGDFDKFHTFDIDYDGYVFTPEGTMDPQNPLSIFFSLEWNMLFSKLFDQFTTFETTFAFHHHPTGDRTGFVHHDFADKSFLSTRKLDNGVIYGNREPNDCIRRRIISLLFYLNNEEWHEGDGGETGIYSPDGKTLLKRVPPINNTLLAFQTSKKSMHAFQSNKVERNSFVQWFHLPPELL